MAGIGWSEDEIERLRDLIARGLTREQMSAHFDRSLVSIKSMASRLNTATSGLPVAVREAIEEYGRAGWSPMRISRQTGVDVAGVQRELAERGIVVTSSVRPRPTGRLSEFENTCREISGRPS